MLFCHVIFVLALISHAYAYTPPTLNCSTGANIQTLDGQINDTFKKGDVLFYTEETLSHSSNCQSEPIFNLTQTNDGTNLTAVSLNVPLASYCNKRIDCGFQCNGGDGQTTSLTVRAEIKRTLVYNLSFTKSKYAANVFENSENNTAVKLDNDLSVEVENCESNNTFPLYGRLYKLHKEPGDDKPFKWGADSNPNYLLVVGQIDFEKKHTYELHVVASMATGENERLNGTATATITVSVQDVDDNNPRFNITASERYILRIPENNSSYVNTSLHTNPPVFAYDPDFGINMNISYTILEQQEAGLFSIDRRDGSIKVAKTLDYEKQKRFTVYIKASQDDKPDTATSQTRIEVQVIDVDDNDPEFIPNQISCSVVEHNAIETVVCTVTAVDKDETPENSNFTYVLWSYADILSVNQDGKITVKNSTMLDRETIGDEITFKVGTKIYDGRYGENATVTMKVIDINDNNPTFEKYNYTFRLTNTTKGAVVGQVNATDLDLGQNSAITYTILPSISSISCAGGLQNSPTFSIDSSSGEITVGADEVGLCQGFVIHVQACDAGINRRCSLTVVSISLPTATSLNLTQNVPVLEGLPIGTAVDLVKCSGTNHGYLNTGGPEFEVSGSTGMLKTLVVLDRETNDSFSFEVNVTNASGMLLCSVSISVSVEDVNDNTPVFVNEPYEFTLPPSPKDGDLLGQIQADDMDLGDNGNVSYYIETDRNTPPFELERISGSLRIKQASLLNEDIMQVYVTAADNGTPPRKQSTVVYVMGKTGEQMVPISTPLSTEQLNKLKQDLTRDISSILNIPVEITQVVEVQNKTSQHKSMIHIKAINSTTSKQYLLSQVVNHYEDIRSLFYTSAETIGTQSHSKSGLGPSEIGLIVMAGVILLGAVLAVVIVHRQFNSQKRYKQLYETLTKNSSLYESQEINVNIEDDGEECNGTVRSRDINEDAPSLEVSALNPAYQSDTTLTTSANLTETEQDNTGDSNNESTDVKEVLERLSESYDQEENTNEQLTEEVDTEQDETQQRVLVEANENTDYVNLILNPNTQSVIPTEEGRDPDSDITKDLITFDNDSNGEGTGQPNNDLESKADVVEPEDEPQPDYNEKQVRFHSEVLDADENKLEPLKVKNDDGVHLDEPANTETGEKHNKDDNTGDIDEPKPHVDERDAAVDTEFESVKDDTDRLEEEIDSPSVDLPYVEQIQDEFYFGDLESTHF